MLLRRAGLHDGVWGPGIDFRALKLDPRGVGHAGARKQTQQMAVVVKTVSGSQFGIGAPPIVAYLSGDWDI